jgi:hypothetical protein
LLGTFGCVGLATFGFGQLNVREWNLTMDRSQRTVDANSLAVLKDESEDYRKAIEHGLDRAELSLDWSVIGTHLLKAQEYEYAFHAYYLAYLLSRGKLPPLRDWCHESLHGLRARPPAGPLTTD